ncbi:cupredoxin domain-containing protein [Pseudarthrobacter sp. Fe7]|nr:cupredoxin domain-containing protein [Pseudarthrobacter sp. Fe7]
MKTKTNPPRLAMALIGTATLIAASACSAAGGANPSPFSPMATGSSSGPMNDAMGASPMASTTAGSAGSSGKAADLTIHIKSFAFTGSESVPAGASVTVMNMDSEAHTVTADDGSFDVVIRAGTSTTFTAPAKAGTYTYHCTYHSNMHGTLNVK